MANTKYDKIDDYIFLRTYRGTQSIIFRPYDKYKSPKRKTVYISGMPTDEAILKAKNMRNAWQHGNLDPWEQKTTDETMEHRLSRVFAAFKADHLDHEWSESTFANLGYVYDDFISEWGKSMNVNEFALHKNRTILKRWRFSSASGDHELAEETQKTYAKCINTFLRWMIDEGYIETTKKIIIKPPSTGQIENKKDYLTEAEFYQMLGGLAEYSKDTVARGNSSKMWMGDVWKVAFYSGLRRKEIQYLRVCDVVHSNAYNQRCFRVGSDQFKTKNRKTRMVPVFPELDSLIDKACDGREGHEQLLPGPERYEYMSRVFMRVRRNTMPNRKGLSFHNLRDSFAMLKLHRDKVRPIEVSHMLGHSKFSTTEEYYLNRENPYRKS